MAMQTVTLDTEYTETYSSSIVTILQIEDLPEEKTLKALVQLGTKKEYKYWVDVISGNTYTPEWTSNDIANAIKLRFIN